MRVLMVQGTSAGGVGRHVIDAARGVSAVGHPVVIAAPATSRPAVVEAFGLVESRPAADGRPGFAAVEISTSPRPAADRRVVARLRRLSRQADVVHAHGLRAGALAALALVGRRTPLVVTLHNLPVGGVKVRAVGEVLLALVARRAQVVLAVSDDLVARARRHGAAVVGRAVVPVPTPVGEDIDDVLAARTLLAGGHPDAWLVLTVGRLAPQKGLEVLIDAATVLTDLPRPVRFVVAGEGPQRDELTERIRRTGAPVTLLGARDDVGSLLRAADLLVVPSHWEGQPLVVQEGLKAGCAVVATRVGGTAEVSGPAAVLVPPRDPAALAAAIRDVLTTPGRLESLRAASRDRAAALPDQEALTAQLVGRYTTLTRGSKQ